ncbi:menaquinol-cytochrome c reductase iron-sulfur subunit [Salsuginibacillus halophilus]|uniref:Menaquinol:cytochrome c reductase iron-sulfur subunit n=1 Tax=Salsuginibacillus halophilus TaxID=517424 RepID=A0A2P8HWA3_9BACI|nr:ubiquinol-cytochrome c reductase iron-sulfur subunit [Salsuginibacillus halophilus]PSL50510.1 menaquinol-cytochrome c reductase iron-sulfur subunit [Salsuginibacillus halophilus]
MSEKNHNVSRRQFLTYTLTGVGGFMAAGMLMPMVRMAVDPVLDAAAEGDMNYLVEFDELGEEPIRRELTYEADDGWYESEQIETIYVYRDGDDVVALSAVCTHLGCTVSWEGSEDYPEMFYCPCHFGLYERDGTNVEGTPPTEPLHRYEYEIRDGAVYVGQSEPQ